MKLRPVQFVIQPVVVADDGKHLRSVQMQQVVVDAADIDEFPAKFRADLAAAELRAVEAPSEGGQSVA